MNDVIRTAEGRLIELAHLPQLEQLTIDVALLPSREPRMLRQTKAMAQVVGALVVGLHAHCLVALDGDI